MPLGIVERIEKNGRDITVFVRADPEGPTQGPPLKARLRPDARWDGLPASDAAAKLCVEFETETIQGQSRAANVRRYVPVGPSLRKILSEHGCKHPGLILDKFAFRHVEQQFARAILDKVIEASKAGQNAFYGDLFKRHQSMLSTLNGASFTAATVGPFTLHLARASALENASICLHPIHGFAYIPGSGLKGMARAWAETIWLPCQSNKEAARRTIEEVFGWASSPERTTSASGAVVFHDAWPLKWPTLELDIINTHHSNYYGAQDNDIARKPGEYAPGDWEDPTMVSFLSIESGTSFQFALSPRAKPPSERLLLLAQQWLMGALRHLGAGAKTNAGYGRLDLVADSSDASKSAKTNWDCAKSTWTDVKNIAPNPPRAEFEATLTLVTPAFLAGAKQQKDDCVLRPTTVRGLLRWWWRTLHAGFLTVAELRKLESDLWGNSKKGGAIQIEISPVTECIRREYNYRDSDRRFMPERQFQHDHNFERPPARTSQGLFYLSYGMNEGDRSPRHYAEPLARWKIRLVTRSESSFNAIQILDQAKSALFLLSHFGGVGSKSRNGFGSFADATGFAEWTLESCLAKARAIRNGQFNPAAAHTPSWEKVVGVGDAKFLEIQTPWKDPWCALDQLGLAYQEFAKQYKHREEKRSLGLPRKGISRSPKNPERHASPFHFHFARQADGCLTLRMVAFADPWLPQTFTTPYSPNHASSHKFLVELVNHMNSNMTRVVANSAIGQWMPPQPPSTGDALAANAVSGTAHSAAIPQDPLDEFRTWFLGQTFSGANKNKHRQIIDRIEKDFANDPQKKKEVLAIVASVLKKEKDRSPGLQKYILEHASGPKL